MNMKRYIAAGMHQALEMVHEELGPDAMILSNRKVAQGVEVIAAVDYEDELLATGTGVGKAATPSSRQDAAPDNQLLPADNADSSPPGDFQQTSADLSLAQVNEEIRLLRTMLEVPLSKLAWAEAGKQSPGRAQLLARLTGFGLHPIVANQIADRDVECDDHEHGWQQALSILEGILPVAEDELLSKGGVAALIGPTGVGKTTTIAKLAARFALQHGRRQVALVTMDHYRIGAHEQLRTYGKLLGVPVFIAGDQQELRVILDQMSDRKLVLIDTAGTSQRDMNLVEQFSTLDVEGVSIRRYLVMSATGQMALNDEVLTAFSCIKPERCILTKVDEATSLGGVISVLIKHKLAAVYMGDGQRVPDDFHALSAKLLLNKAVELADSLQSSQSDEQWMQAFGDMEVAAHAHANI